MSEKTFFGFKEINKTDKEKMVGGVFSNVANKYDIMNDAMSFGIHRIWKNELIATLNPKDNSKLLDVAGGTGDIAFKFLKKSPTSYVTICDINQNMLDEGQKRAIDNGILNNIIWKCGNAEKLKEESNNFDYYTIAFGIRNVTNINKALKEAYRVLKPGGKFMCLEFSHVENELIGNIYDKFSFDIIPKLGKLIADDSESYQYLIESIRQFPTQEKFKNMICDAGFERVSFRNLTFGVAAIHSGWKI